MPSRRPRFLPLRLHELHPPTAAAAKKEIAIEPYLPELTHQAAKVSWRNGQQNVVLDPHAKSAGNLT